MFMEFIGIVSMSLFELWAFSVGIIGICALIFVGLPVTLSVTEGNSSTSLATIYMRPKCADWQSEQNSRTVPARTKGGNICANETF
jgi:hypothetical protein